MQIKALQEKGSFQESVTLSMNAGLELKWWIQKISNGRCLVQNPAQITIQTDASKSIWGASCQGQTTRGVWSQKESQYHINVLELLAVKLTLISFVRENPVKPIHFQIDNTTAIRYLLKMRGGGYQALPWYWRISTQCLKRDSRSRVQRDYGQFGMEIGPKKLLTTLGNPIIDLFASHISH